MKTKYLLVSTITALTMASPLTQAVAADYGPLQLWRSYSGVTWDDPQTSAVTPFANSVNAPIAGVHIARSGKVFVSTPRVVAKDAPATLNILDTTVQSGPARLTAFPSTAGNSVTDQPGENLRNVIGFYIDNTNGWIWALDMGFVAGEKEAPAGAQKILVLNQDTGALVKRISLDSVADGKASFLNDIVVDERRKIAYIADSGLRGNDAGIVVVDFNADKVRRVLDKAASVQPEPGVDTMAHGLPVLPGSPLKVGINGITLSPDKATLYWTVTTGLHAHAVSTSVLRNEKLTDAEITKQVRNLGNVGGNTDGIVAGARGNLYITDITRNGIVRYDIRAKKMKLLFSDERIHWPDTITVTNNGDLLFVSNALNEHFMGAIKAGEERYNFWRMPSLAK